MQFFSSVFRVSVLVCFVLMVLSCHAQVENDTVRTNTVIFNTKSKDGTIVARANGEVIKSGAKIKNGTLVILTAMPNDSAAFSVGTWSVINGKFEADTGKQGDDTAKVIINADTTVTVSFNSLYTKVPYVDLANYMKTTALTSKINYIEVTGVIPPQDFQGIDSDPGKLGKIFEDYPDKKVNLKLPETVPGLTSMESCFSSCKGIVSVYNIPTGVTNLNGCFFLCEGLQSAPVIPKDVTDKGTCFTYCKNLTTVTLKCNYSGDDKFESVFFSCHSLGKNSIIVPLDQVSIYRAHAQEMGISADCFIGASN